MNKINTEINNEIKIYSYKSKKINVLITLFCRMIMLISGLHLTYLKACTHSPMFYFFLFFSLVIILDTCFVCIKRNGIDFKW